jgi:protein-tyrosine phosphatase
MCPNADKSASHGSAAPWVAIPRQNYVGDTLIITRSSNFASRARCSKCDAGIYLRYDCEPHTDWVLGSNLAAPFDLAITDYEHIHHPSINGTHQDGHNCSTSWGKWVSIADPCRPFGTPPPEVCMTCWQSMPDQCSCCTASPSPPSAQPSPPSPPLPHIVVPNFRELGSDVGLSPGLLFRSSNPWNCSDEDARWLLEDVGIQCVQDLRTPFECNQLHDQEMCGALSKRIRGNAGNGIRGIRVVHAPLLNQAAMQRYVFLQADWSTRFTLLGIAVGLITLESVQHRINPLISAGGLERMYESIVDDCRQQLKECFESMLKPDGLPCLLHCTSGKDRTGVLSALILSVCGVNDDVIFDNYVETEKYKKELFEDVSSPTVAHFTDESMQSAPRSVLMGIFAKLRAEHGSIEKYVDVAVGLGSMKRKKLVEKLTVGSTRTRTTRHTTAITASRL